MLYIATLVFAKLSIISLLVILTASEIHRNVGIVVIVLISLWGIVAEFVIGFQCGPVEPWRFFHRSAHCLDLVSEISFSRFSKISADNYRPYFGALWVSSTS